MLCLTRRLDKVIIKKMIRSLEVKNFKSISDAKAKFPTFGAIVGLNAAGKSNLIQVVEFARSLVKGVELEFIQSRIGSTAEELFNLRDRSLSKPFSICIEVESEDGQVYILTFAVSLKKSLSDESSLVISEESLVSEHEGRMIDIYRRNQEGAIFDENREVTSFTVREDKLWISNFNDSHAEKVRKIFRDVRIHHFDVRSRWLYPEGRNDSISRLISSLMKRDELYVNFLKIIKDVMPNFSDFKEIEILGEKAKNEVRRDILLLLQEKSLQGYLTMRSLSEGDLRTLFILATGLDMPPNSTFLIEEIENGMHPDRVTKVVEYLDTFSKAKNIQIIFSTHSPIVINDLTPKNIIFVEKDEQGSNFTLLSESEDVGKIKDLLKGGGRLSDYIMTKSQ
mgnify:CR=1 FL=1